MNGSEGNTAPGEGQTTTVVTALLPSGAPVRLEVAAPESRDGMTSVGLQDIHLDKALDVVGEIGSVVVKKLKAAKPTKATVELKFGFAVEAGKLTALWVGGKGEASLTVTLEWSEHPAAPGDDDG
ncbi:MAG TPA: CU044_2847 family protein [Streptosporangiaceae bacterium]|nr:CU044_2847 family protein [Streptosporangiaceae bacterium]